MKVLNIFNKNFNIKISTWILFSRRCKKIVPPSIEIFRYSYYTCRKKNISRLLFVALIPLAVRSSPSPPPICNERKGNSQNFEQHIQQFVYRALSRRTPSGVQRTKKKTIKVKVFDFAFRYCENNLIVSLYNAHKGSRAFSVKQENNNAL